VSLIGAKYIPSVGWVVVKNRDSAQKPSVRIRKSFRRNIERLYLWDESTKYAEGVNEYGVAVISCDCVRDAYSFRSLKTIKNPTRFFYDDGLRLRKSLFELTAKDALDLLIQQQVVGKTIIADKDHCYILIASKGAGEYMYHADYLNPSMTYIDGADGDNTEERLKAIEPSLRDARTQEDVLSAFSAKGDATSPIISSVSKNTMKTSGQIVIVPGDRTLHFRPIWCEVAFNLESLNKETEKTFFEIVSTRKLITFKEFFNVSQHT